MLLGEPGRCQLAGEELWWDVGLDQGTTCSHQLSSKLHLNLIFDDALFWSHQAPMQGTYVIDK